jgi:transcriptional regulator with GAF, ATPase, and Fis domain
LLFGHCRGAFSGAHGNHPGFVREADGGTLFLDEIGELPLEVQPVLLRCLQESEITPVGAARPSKVDFRLVSATNRNLPAMVAAGQFREDLYSRLFGLEIQLPPLRERLEDIGLLIRSILQRSSSCSPGQRFEPEATLAILSHGWPMNVRELERCLHCAVVLAGDEPIGLRHLPAAVRASEDRWTVHQGPALLISRAGGLVDAASAVARLSDEDERRRDHLVQLMRKHRGNVAAVSSELGKARMQIHRWLKRYAINPYPYRAS